MRDCTEYEALVSAFIDGDLREEDRELLMEHMAACPACQTYFDDQIAIHDALCDMEETAVPADFTAGVMEKIRTEGKPEKKVIQFPRWRRFAALAACCAVVILGVWTIGGMESLSPVARTDNAAPAARTVTGDVPTQEAAPELALMDGTDALEAKTGESPRDIPEDAGAEPALLPTCGAVSAGGGAARAWVEEELELPWVPGERYELTAEQYAALLAALEEAEEVYAAPAPAADAEGYWLIME